jgi:putative hydrolase
MRKKADKVSIDITEYRMTYDLHTHTRYSHGWIMPHGKGTIDQNIVAARQQGLQGIAISDHGPGHYMYGLKRSKIPEMRAEIEREKKLYPDMDIYLSVEANIMESDNGLDLQKDEQGQFDFLLAGYHYGVMHCHSTANHLGGQSSTGARRSRLVAANTDMYIRALYENDIKVLTHPGDKGPVDMTEVAKACAETKTLMEINSRHQHLTVEEIREAMKEDVLFIIDSDAHTPAAVGSYENGLQRAADAGLEFERIVNIERVSEE